MTICKLALSDYFHLEPSQALTTPFSTAVSAHLVLICIWPLSRDHPLCACGAGLAGELTAVCLQPPQQTQQLQQQADGQGMQEEPCSPMTLVWAEGMHPSLRQDGGSWARKRELPSEHPTATPEACPADQAPSFPAWKGMSR